MTQTEAKKIFIKHGNKTIERWGFREKKISRAEAKYIKIKDTGFERFGVSTLNYIPIVVFRLGCIKRLDVIENILNKINLKFSLNLNLESNDFTIACIKNKKQFDLNLPQVEGEQGVIVSVQIILKYIEKDVLPMFNLFDDLREIDKLINEGENILEYETSEFKLGQDGWYRRFIIARLCKSDNKFDDFLHQWIQEVNKKSLEQNGEIAVDENSKNDETIQFFRYLKENIKSLY